MIKVFLEEYHKPIEVYKNLYNLFSSEAEYNGMVTNVHSVSNVGYEGSVYNVTYDYDNDIRVMIHVLNDGSIHIEAPDDMITGTESLIAGEFPEYINLFV